MRSLPDSFDKNAVAEIDSRLLKIMNDENVIIPLAIESGSRAWGFPSPDSDYDCRFVFVRPVENSFTLFSKRDVIETPLTPLIDVNGWELSKALKLLLSGNAVIVEWLTSPLVYHANLEFRADFLKLAGEVCDRNDVSRHYFHLARNQFNRSVGEGKDIGLKKIFYSLRPLMALRWMRFHADQRIAPMHFPTLCDEADLPADLMRSIQSLMALKAQTREMGTGVVPGVIMEFLTSELELAAKWTAGKGKSDDESKKEKIDFFWRHWLSALHCDRNNIAKPSSSVG